jgi:hypothetical protein
MAKGTPTPAECLRNTLIESEPDFLRTMIEVMTRALMEMKVASRSVSRGASAVRIVKTTGTHWKTGSGTRWKAQ